MHERARAVEADEDAFIGAERVVVRDGDGRSVQLVVLAVMEHGDGEFAYAAREEDLGRMAVGTVYRYLSDGNGAALLSTVDDDDVYDGVLHAFQELFDEEF